MWKSYRGIILENIGRILGKEKFVLLRQGTKELILPETDLGVEVELERVAGRTLTNHLDHQMQIYWEWHQDNSLHDNGMEFTFKTPMFGEDVIVATRGLLAAAQKAKWAPSLRTGIHIHMDARDLQPAQLLGLLTYYIIFEPAIYAWIGDDRHANNFCLPWFKSEEAIDSAINILKMMQQYNNEMGEFEERAGRGSILDTCNEFDRYAGLNLKSLAEFGSIEFRHLKTTLEWPRVLDWMNIILSLKKAAIDAPDSTLAIVNGVMRRGIATTLNYIFGERIAVQMAELGSYRVPELIRDISIPNAVEFIGKITEASGKIKPQVEWESSLDYNPKKVNHPGFVLWRSANFPKTESKNQEKLKPKKEKEKTDYDRLAEELRLGRGAGAPIGWPGEDAVIGAVPPPVVAENEFAQFAQQFNLNMRVVPPPPPAAPEAAPNPRLAGAAPPPGSHPVLGRHWYNINDNTTYRQFTDGRWYAVSAALDAEMRRLERDQMFIPVPQQEGNQ